MKQLIKINGIKEIEGMKFHDIEGGFGEDKKLIDGYVNIIRQYALKHGIS